MHIKVINYRRCVEAEFDLAKVALIVGRNSEGKSSLVQAAALALTHTALPYGLTKGAAGSVVNDGAKAAYVEVATEEGGTVKIGWPSSSVETTGKAPMASPFAVGLLSLVSLDDKERSEALVRLIKAMPTKDDLGSALGAIGMKAPSIDRIWLQIEAQGWGIAFKEAEDTRAARKSDFEQITGETWGSDKGATWRPDGWSEDLDGATEADLDQAVTLARAKVDDALLAQGADEGEKARLRGIADTLPTLEAELATAETDLQAKADAVVKAQKEREALPQTVGAKAAEPELHPCPSCGTVIELRTSGGGLAPTHSLVEHKAATASKAKPDAETGKKIAAADGTLSRVRAEHQAAQIKAHRAGASMQEATNAATKLAGMKTAASAETTAAARSTVADAEAKASAWKRRRDALSRHKAILNWDAVAKVLAPTGLRQKKLTESLDAFNTQMRQLCEAAAWPVVSASVGEKGVQSQSNGRDYRLIGDNEQWRVRAVLACTAAMFDGSEAIVLDGADVLDMSSRSGLLKLIEATGKPAMIAMTASLPRNKVPDLAKSGRGETFVIENGTLRAYDAKKDEVA